MIALYIKSKIVLLYTTRSSLKAAFVRWHSLKRECKFAVSQLEGSVMSFLTKWLFFDYESFMITRLNMERSWDRK